jgi:hypothetical protein
MDVPKSPTSPQNPNFANKKHIDIVYMFSYCYTMKSNNLKKRLQKNRPMDVISLRMPKDVIDDLKRIAPLLGFSGYQPLIRAYIGQGLRVDIERLEGGPDIAKFVEGLKRRGVNENIIAEAIAEFGDR